MTIEEVKQHLGAVVLIPFGFYEIVGFTDQPVVILRKRVDHPGVLAAPEMQVMLPEAIELPPGR